MTNTRTAKELATALEAAKIELGRVKNLIDELERALVLSTAQGWVVYGNKRETCDVCPVSRKDIATTIGSYTLWVEDGVLQGEESCGSVSGMSWDTGFTLKPGESHDGELRFFLTKEEAEVAAAQL